MDPLSLSTFLTLIGLVTEYLREKRYQKDNAKATDLEELKAWLSQKHHDELISAIESNCEISLGLKELLNNNHDDLKNSIHNLTVSIGLIAEHMTGWNRIYKAIPSSEHLSPQAVRILHEINDRKLSGVIYMDMGAHKFFVAIEGGPHIEVSDPRFIESDLDTLVKLKLLLPRNIRGDRGYFITHTGADLATNS